MWGIQETFSAWEHGNRRTAEGNLTTKRRTGHTFQTNQTSPRLGERRRSLPRTRQLLLPGK